MEWEVAETQANRVKNRYTNILACEFLVHAVFSLNHLPVQLLGELGKVHVVCDVRKKAMEVLVFCVERLRVLSCGYLQPADDHSRVKLLPTEDDEEGSDYINANYMPVSAQTGQKSLVK